MTAILSGLFRVTREPEVRYTSEGKAVANISAAWSWGSKKNEAGYLPTQFIDLVMWERRAEAVVPHLEKGSRFFAVVRDLHGETYERSDGGQGWKLTGTITEFAFAGDRGAQQSGDAEQRQGDAKPGAAQSKAPAPAARRAPASFEGMDDDIPF